MRDALHEKSRLAQRGCPSRAQPSSTHTRWHSEPDDFAILLFCDVEAVFLPSAGRSCELQRARLHC